MPSTKKDLRLRVFAGPNGSGKSTIINAVKEYRANGKPIDFGTYINADEIAQALRKKGVQFKKFKVKTTQEEFIQIALASGLINEKFPESEFINCFNLEDNKIKLSEVNKAQLIDNKSDEALAQIIADFLRKTLLKENKKFSFETVFSHPSKLNIMREAAEAGYKVYLYFVSTESPEINKFRVSVRAKQGGHDVPPDKIESRYFRSLNLLFDAAQLVYQCYFFDNSKEEFKLFSHFKNEKGDKQWDKLVPETVPDWFIKYYSNKVKSA